MKPLAYWKTVASQKEPNDTRSKAWRHWRWARIVTGKWKPRRTGKRTPEQRREDIRKAVAKGRKEGRYK